MASHAKVINLSDGRHIKRSQALGRIAQCISAWVEEGFSIRDLTLSEMVKSRSEKAREIEPLAMAEIPGVKVIGLNQDYALVNAANWGVGCINRLRPNA